MIEKEQDLKKCGIHFLGPTDTLRKGRQVFRDKKSQEAVAFMTEQQLVQNASSSSTEMRRESIMEEIIQRFSSNKKILHYHDGISWDTSGILRSTHMRDEIDTF